MTDQQHETRQNAAAADAQGHMIAQFDDGQGNKGRPQPVTGAAGRDPASIGADVGHSLATLLRPLGRFWPF